MTKTKHKKCLVCGEPEPEWYELCQMCWEEYTGDQWCAAVGGEAIESVDDWIAEKRGK